MEDGELGIEFVPYDKHLLAFPFNIGDEGIDDTGRYRVVLGLFRPF